MIAARMQSLVIAGVTAAAVLGPQAAAAADGPIDYYVDYVVGNAEYVVGYTGSQVDYVEDYLHRLVYCAGTVGINGSDPLNPDVDIECTL